MMKRFFSRKFESAGLWVAERSPALKRLWDRFRRLRHRERWVAGGALFVLLMILLCQDEPSATLSQREEWYTVRKGPFVVDLLESGEVQALSKRTVSTPMMWSSNMQIIDLAPEGAFVEKGDFLVQFDASELEERYELNQESLESLKADLQRILAQQKRKISELESNLVLAEYTHQQAQLTMEAQQYESEAKKEEAKIQLKQAEISLKTNQEMLEAQRIIDKSELLRIHTSIRQAESDLDMTKQRIEMLRLTAPTSGLVVYEEVGSWNSRERLRIGYTARPGETLITIPNLAEMQVKTFVNEVDRANIVPGQSVDISLEAYPEAVFTGEVADVARLAQMIEYEDNLKGFAVNIRINGTDERLKPGMTAKVRIHLKDYNDVIAVPLGTVYEIDGRPVVFKGRGRSRTYVQFGERNDGSVVITDGVEAGDRLSWTAPEETVQILGMRDEQQRIQDLAVALRRSFSEFESRGILFDYFKQAASGRREATEPPPESPEGIPRGLPGMDSRDADWQAIRERMQQSGGMPEQPSGSGGRPPSGMTPQRGSGQTPQNPDWEAIRKRMQESGQFQGGNRGQWPGQRGGQRRGRDAVQTPDRGAQQPPNPENHESQADQESTRKPE